MTLNIEENLAIQVQDKSSKKWLQKIFAKVNAKRTRGQTVADIMVIVVALPMLIGCSILLHTTMRLDWVKDVKMRWRILGLGLSLLFISLLVCFYATHRLGLSIWKSQQQHILATGRVRRRTISSRGVLPAPLIATDSEMQLMVREELPPSYDSIMAYSELPPPYSSTTIRDEKATEVTRSTYPSPNLLNVPPGTG